MSATVAEERATENHLPPPHTNKTPEPVRGNKLAITVVHRPLIFHSSPTLQNPPHHPHQKFDMSEKSQVKPQVQVTQTKLAPHKVPFAYHNVIYTQWPPVYRTMHTKGERSASSSIFCHWSFSVQRFFQSLLAVRGLVGRISGGRKRDKRYTRNTSSKGLLHDAGAIRYALLGEG